MMQRPFDLTIDPSVALRIADLAMERASGDYASDFDNDGPDTDQRDDPIPDDHALFGLQEGPPGPVEQELEGLIAALSVDAVRDLLALLWFGRGNYTARDWHEVRREAGQVSHLHVADYLEQTPLASEWIRSGLSVLGYDNEI